MPTAATDSPSATMMSAPCRSTKCVGWISNRPATRTISGERTWMASAAAHSTYAAAPPRTPARMTHPAEARLNGATRAMFWLTR